MGTRNLTYVKIDKTPKVAQYGQWDGYPSGRGIEILKFLRDQMNRPKMEERLRALSWIDGDEVYENPEYKNAYQFDRDCGSDILELIQNGSLSKRGETKYWIVDKLINVSSFAADSLFCEWAYVVDFDENTFEIYRGFVKEPHTGERFSDMEGQDGYYPVKLRKTYDLNSLPSNEEFLNELDPIDPEEYD